ncbi:MAG: ribonuclease E inhibitor RraB [Gaiellaceae bacterium]
MGLIDRIRNMGAPATPDEADRLAVRQLAGLGADLSLPRHVLHFLSAPDGASAHRAAAAAERLGYETSVEQPPDGRGDWTVRATGARVVDSSTVAAFRATFERLADETGTAYEGWEAAPKP